MTVQIQHEAGCDANHTRRQRCNQKAAERFHDGVGLDQMAPNGAAHQAHAQTQVFCSSCGTPTFDGAAYCYRCGDPIIGGSLNPVRDATPSAAYNGTEIVRLRPDPLWEDARGWRAAAWTGAAALVLGVIILQAAPAAGILTIGFGGLAIAGFWIARSETNGWADDGPAWVALGRVLWIVFRIALILTVIGYALSKISDRR